MWRVLWVAGFIALAGGGAMAEDAAGANAKYTFDMAAAESARRPLKVTLPPGAASSFYEAVRRLAAAEGCEAHVELMKMDFDFATVSVWRSDLAIFGANYRRPLEFELSIFIDRSKGGNTSRAEGLLAKLGQELVRVPGAMVEPQAGVEADEPVVPHEALRELGRGYLQDSFEEATKWDRPPGTEQWNDFALWISEGVRYLTPTQRRQLIEYFDQLLMAEPSNEKLEALWESMKTDWYVKGPHGARAVFMLIRNRLEHSPN